MKKLLGALLLLISSLAWADFDACKGHFFGNEPAVRKSTDTQYELCNKGYAVLYDGSKRIPLVAFAEVTAEELEGARQLSRKGIEFHVDERVKPEHQSKSEDYLRSNFDRGHMIGNAFFGDKQSQVESFLMTNISPQLPHVNRELFSKIESDTRKYVRRTGHTIYIVVGVSNKYDECRLEIKKHVCVIDNLWLAVNDPVANKSWAFWLHNAGDAKMPRPISVKNLEKRLGYKVFR